MAIVAVGGTAASPESQTFQDTVAVTLKEFENAEALLTDSVIASSPDTFSLTTQPNTKDGNAVFIRINCSVARAGATMSLTGTDYNGDAQTDNTIDIATASPNVSVTSTKKFKTIDASGISISGMTNGDTVTVSQAGAPINFISKATEFKPAEITADFETEPTLAGGLLRKWKSREASEMTVKLYTINPESMSGLINSGMVLAQESGTNATGKVYYPTLERKQYRLSVLYSEEFNSDNDEGDSAEVSIATGKKALRHVYRFVEITKCTLLNDDKNLHGAEITIKTQPFDMNKPTGDKVFGDYFTDLLEYSEYFDGTAGKASGVMGQFDGVSG